MKQILSLIAATLQITSSVAYATEDSWEQLTIPMPRIQNQIVGFKTDAGTFRLTEAMPGTAELQIYGGIFKANPTKSETRCRGYGDALRTAKEAWKNTYHLRGFIYPFAASELKKLKPSIENTPDVSVVEVTLTVQTGAKPITTLASVLEFQENIKNSIMANIAAIRDSGEFSIDLEKIDDIACDLILGNVVLEVRYGLMLELAKHIRKPIMTADEFGSIFENLQNRVVSSKQVSQIHVVNGAHLQSAISKELNKSFEDFEEMKFLKIAGAMFDSNTGALKNYERAQYAQAARSLDLLKIYRTMIPYSQNFKPTTPAKP